MFYFFTHKPIRAIFISGFLFAFHVALTTYINSTFLSQFTKTPGLVYVFGSLLALLGLIFAPNILKKLGVKKTLFNLSFISIATLLLLSIAQKEIIILSSFVVYLATLTLLFYCLDIFLEEHSKDETTGSVRGLYLSTINSAWLFAPILSGLIVEKSSYGIVYIISIFSIIPIFFIIGKTFKNFKDPEYRTLPIKESLNKIKNNKDLKYIFISAFLLQFFYAIMTIFLPIYLFTVVGFSWSTIGLMFTIMLLPFVLLERPLGYIADKYLGEKEILSAGFIIISLFTIVVAFINGTNPLIWALVLFMTRVGAASVEVMNDSYFFKHIDPEDAGIIGIFRGATPFAYVLSPLIATLILLFTNYQNLFAILGGIMLLGLISSISIKDTK